MSGRWPEDPRKSASRIADTIENDDRRPDLGLGQGARIHYNQSSIDRTVPRGNQGDRHMTAGMTNTSSNQTPLPFRSTSDNRVYPLRREGFSGISPRNSSTYVPPYPPDHDPRNEASTTYPEYAIMYPVQATQELYRRPPAGNTGLSSSLPIPERQPQSNLPPSVQDFLAIRLNDFEACCHYLSDHPEILEQNVNQIQREALDAYRRRDDETGDRMVQRILLIRHCQNLKSLDSALNYIKKLQASRSTYESFESKFESVSTQLRQNARVSGPQWSGPNSMDIAYRPGPHAGASALYSPRPNQLPRNAGMSMGNSNFRTGMHGPNMSHDRGQLIKGPNSTLTLAHSGAPGISGANTEAARGYQIRPDAGNFFKPGRVFTVIWTQPAGQQHHQTGKVYQLPNGTWVYSKIMWMMVAAKRAAYSICCPISRYGGQALLKPGLKEREIRAHAIVYSQGQKAVRLHREPPTVKDDIKIKMAAGAATIDAASRVHFGKFHTVEFYVAVKDVGRVCQEQVALIQQYFKAETGDFLPALEEDPGAEE